MSSSSKTTVVQAYSGLEPCRGSAGVRNGRGRYALSVAVKTTHGWQLAFAGRVGWLEIEVEVLNAQSEVLLNSVRSKSRLRRSGHHDLARLTFKFSATTLETSPHNKTCSLTLLAGEKGAMRLTGLAVIRLSLTAVTTVGRLL